jgi:hypothetical protein
LSTADGNVDSYYDVIADDIGNDVGFGGGILLVATVGPTRHKAA